MHTIVSALKTRKKEISFSQMQEKYGSFDLVIVGLDLEDLGVHYPRCASAMFDDFEDLDAE